MLFRTYFEPQHTIYSRSLSLLLWKYCVWNMFSHFFGSHVVASWRKSVWNFLRPSSIFQKTWIPQIFIDKATPTFSMCMESFTLATIQSFSPHRILIRAQICYVLENSIVFVAICTYFMNEKCAICALWWVGNEWWMKTYTDEDDETKGFYFI
jgi:hypothetical protein